MRYEKVQGRFRGDVVEDAITLYAIETEDKVKSYDLKKLSDEILNELEARQTTLEASREKSRGNINVNYIL